MAKRSRTQKAKPTPSASGAKGGPSTGRGLNYQIDVAIEQTLDYIARALCAPHRIWEVRLEPRVSAVDGLTNWDIGFNPDNTLTEVKLKPTNEDIQEWIKRVANDGLADPTREFHLVFSKGAGKHLDNLDRLIRIAVEADGNETEFAAKSRAEGIENDDPYLAALGTKAHELLRHMKMDQVPEYLLKTNIAFRARQLAGESGGRRLSEYLFKKFHEALPDRRSFSIVELIEEVQRLGIQFQPPASVDTSDISSTATGALIIMQACKVGIPTRVVAEALGSSEADIEAELLELKDSHVVALDEGLWSMKPLPTIITSDRSQDILANALSSLLTFIDNTPVNANIRACVDNVIALSKKCRASHSTLVAHVFTRLDKRLKRLGNKQLVWFVANLSRQAARAVGQPDREVVEAEARALICGTSWAFQRLHKVEKARIDADEAYSLAQSVRLDRTLAFCMKCRGRLRRMEAEQLTDGKEKELKLQESVLMLKEAVEKFSQLTEFGPTDPEVGDCYSLLGRSYLRSGELRMTEESIRKAYALIVDETSKDYIDLLILNGEFEVARGDRDGAATLYDRALEVSTGSDPEVSEMRARAFFQRGLNRQAMGRKREAQADYQAAEKIWSSLQDEEFAAQAAWKKISIDGSISPRSLAVLSKETSNVKVRVEATRMYTEALQQSAPSTVAKRSEPPVAYWRSLIRQADERLALRGNRSETEW
jgi:tetratricopeptide (TPR) repeat protein